MISALRCPLKVVRLPWYTSRICQKRTRLHEPEAGRLDKSLAAAAGSPRRSADLDRAFSFAGTFPGKDDQVPIERRRNPGERVDPFPGAAAFLDSRDHRLGGSHPLGKLAFAEPGFGAQVVDQLAERELLLDRGPRLLGRWPVLSPGVVK
jgi:hypothetical protein